MWRRLPGGGPSLPHIETERLELTVLDRGDADEVLDYYRRNREFLRPWVPKRTAGFHTRRYQQQLLSRDVAETLSKTKLPLWIRRKSDGLLIGTAVFSNIIYGSFQSCFLGYNLDTGAVRKGFMTEALRAAIQYVFENLRLHRIEANVMPRNEASQKLLTKLGFRREGYSPRYLEIAGAWEDHLRMALLREEWAEGRPIEPASAR
jgi:ribosomal-protein-alanine N-acetyltransferase